MDILGTMLMPPFRKAIKLIEEMLGYDHPTSKIMRFTPFIASAIER